MHNSKAPEPAELPTSRQLVRSTVIALVIAGVVLVAAVLPSEYGIDPTGLGRVLGLTEMGEVKAQLAQEAEAEAAQPAAVETAADAPDAVASQPVAAGAGAEWRDEMRVTLEPGQGAEIKLVMKKGERAEFQWQVEGGAVNYDLHGEGAAESTSYEKGRDAPSREGAFEAAFDGNHGWFWRNRGSAAVTVVLRARGQYAQMKRVL